MTRLPVIVAQGGISPAGRTSGFHGYHRLVFDQLETTKQQQTLAALAQVRGMETDSSALDILSGSLVRKLESNLFDNNALYYHHPLKISEGSELIVPFQRMPSPLPEGWQVLEEHSDKSLRIRITGTQPLMLPAHRSGTVNAAGQLPSGFKPEAFYQSRNHPRALAMTVYGASDAVLSSGLNWDAIKKRLSPDDMAVYAGSGMSQLDYNGNGGLMKARLMGKRVTSKQCPLGFAEMPADFINAYILGSLGNTGTSVGACATLLYNLQQGVNDIRNSKHRLVIVGNSEAPVTPEVMEGYSTMGALGTDAALRKLDGLDPHEHPDWCRACRPFSDNVGFTLSESAQFFILMDDELAIETGADILGAVADVFVNADGHKKSISAPGAGNYLTVAKAAALGRTLLGEEALRHRSFVQAHGTGTPQNRVTESHILNETAKVFGIDNWAVSAVKSYVGHSIGVAAGDQLMSTLGVWQSGIIPGIKTIERVADDVHKSHLNITKEHIALDANAVDMSLVNAKGFGGNNATALVLSPTVTRYMLQAKHGKTTLAEWEKRHDATTREQDVFETQHADGSALPIYRFGHDVLSGNDLEFTDKALNVPGFGKPVDLEPENPYWTF